MALAATTCFHAETRSPGAKAERSRSKEFVVLVQREIRDIDHANSIKATLEAATLTIKVKVGTGNRLFGSVTDKDVAAVIKSAVAIDIDRHSIKMAGHIKKIGTHSAKVSLEHHVTAVITLTVVAE